MYQPTHPSIHPSTHPELKDNWEAISEQVGLQKDVTACVLQFLSLPLERDLSGGMHG